MGATEYQYKTVGVSGVRDLSDSEGPGVVEAIVSVTGIVDNVGDIIEPGAYAHTLKHIKPKGVWSHDWNQPISKTLLAKELLPGDPDLPKTQPNGDPWPKEAGALKVKMQFNLNSRRGRDAYEDVKFFGPDQQWSIGYNVPEGSAEQKSGGPRHIRGLNWYEYSPVLHGAMPIARTTSVKTAQLAYKTLQGDTTNNELLEKLMGKDNPTDEFKMGYYPEDEDDEDEDDEGKQLTPELVRNAIKSLEEVLEKLEGGGKSSTGAADIAYLESKALMYSTVMDALTEAWGVKSSEMQALVAASREYDSAIDSGDVAVASKSYAAFLDLVEKSMDTIGTDHDAYPVFQVAVRTAMDRFEGMEKSGTQSTRVYGPAITAYTKQSGVARMGMYLDELAPGILTELKDYYPVDSSMHTLIDTAIEQKKDYSAADRKKLAAEGMAMEDGSFPIKTAQDLKNAIKRCASGKHPAAAKKFIMKRAEQMGRMDLIPDDWKSSGEQIETKSETDTLVIPKSFLDSLQKSAE